MKLSKKLVITHHNPLRIVATIVFFCVLIVASMWTFFEKNHWLYIQSNLREGKRNAELRYEDYVASNTIVQLEERIILLERTVQIEKQTITDLQADIIKQQDKAYKMREELEFYQGIMTLAGESKDFRIQALRIKKTSQARSYYFNLILTHVSKDDTVVTGELLILLEGVQDGILRTIDIQELSLSKSLPLTFKLSSFERIKGNFILPEGFVSHRVIVLVRQESSKKKIPEKKRIFDWSEAMQY